MLAFAGASTQSAGHWKPAHEAVQGAGGGGAQGAGGLQGAGSPQGPWTSSFADKPDLWEADSCSISWSSASASAGAGAAAVPETRSAKASPTRTEPRGIL